MRTATPLSRARPILLGLLVAAALVAVTATAPRLGGGTEQATAQEEEESSIVVSLDADTSDGPCTDIDSSVSHATGDIYNVAICAQGLYEGYPIGSFTFDVIYDDTKNIAPEVADTGEGLDDNPDANAGATFWGDGLGTGWDCSASTLAFPKGDRNAATGPGNGDAFIACESLLGPWTLGDNETAGVIAVISFAAITEGTDVLEIADTSYLAYSTGSSMGECDPASLYPMTCNDASDTNGGAPVPVPTASIGPTAAPPPVLPPPTDIVPPSAPAPVPVIVAPPTGSEPAADGSPWMPLVWLLAGATGAAIAAGGFLRLAKRRQR